MKKVLPIIVTIILSIGLLVFLYLKLALVSFSVQNNIPGYNFGVSSLAGNLFLYTQKYDTNLRGADYKKINIVFTSVKQDAVRLMLEGAENPTSSMGVDGRGDTLTIKEQYSQNALISIMNGTNIQGYKIDPDQDLYTHLCMIFDPAKPGRDACYQKAGDYIQKLGNFPSIKFVNTAKKISFNLVGKVSAASCCGTIKCGGELTGLYCQDGNKCSPSGSICLSDGSVCKTRTICDLSLNNLQCSSITNQNTCSNNSGVGNCYTACNKSAENFCSWLGSCDGGATYTCSTNGGTCAATGTCPEGLHIDTSVGTCPSGQNCCIGASGGGPTPPPASYQCTVQGYKVLMPGLLTGLPADSQTVTLNDPATSTSAQPYFLYYQSAGKSRTVQCFRTCRANFSSPRKLKFALWL